MARAITATLVAVTALFSASPAQATVVINDPARPVSDRVLRNVERWTRIAKVRMPARVILHAGDCGQALMCANVTRCTESPTGWCESVGDVWFAVPPTREDVMHELGHVFDATTYTEGLRSRLTVILHGGGAWFASRGVHELAADAYARCAIHRYWPGKWWQRITRDGEHVDDPTAYGFRAGPMRYARICATIRSSA